MSRAVLVASISLGLAAAGGCSPYSPDLGERPFQCGETDPPCPNGYTCDTTTTPPTCLEVTEGPDADHTPDGPGGPCAGVGDLLEPNNAMNMPTQTSVADTRQFTEYVGTTICPADDVDYYFVNVPTNGLNVDATVNYAPEMGQVAVQILNMSGVMVQSGAPIGPGSLKAALSNASQGQYYVVVRAQPGMTNNYSILIDTRRP